MHNHSFLIFLLCLSKVMIMLIALENSPRTHLSSAFIFSHQTRISYTLHLHSHNLSPLSAHRLLYYPSSRKQHSRSYTVITWVVALVLLVAVTLLVVVTLLLHLFAGYNCLCSSLHFPLVLPSFPHDPSAIPPSLLHSPYPPPFFFKYCPFRLPFLFPTSLLPHLPFFLIHFSSPFSFPLPYLLSQSPSRIVM